MEKVIEWLLVFLWDIGKTIILQWIIDQLKEWWEAGKNLAAPQYA
jgi:hypothetical protein